MWPGANLLWYDERSLLVRILNCGWLTVSICGAVVRLGLDGVKLGMHLQQISICVK